MALSSPALELTVTLRPHLQQIAFKKLLARNQARIANTPPESRIHLPFIVISTSDQTTIQLEMDTPERCATLLPLAVTPPPGT